MQATQVSLQVMRRDSHPAAQVLLVGAVLPAWLLLCRGNAQRTCTAVRQPQCLAVTYVLSRNLYAVLHFALCNRCHIAPDGIVLFHLMHRSVQCLGQVQDADHGA
jgi:hypothetical protein